MLTHDWMMRNVENRLHAMVEMYFNNKIQSIMINYKCEQIFDKIWTVLQINIIFVDNCLENMSLFVKFGKSFQILEKHFSFY